MVSAAPVSVQVSSPSCWLCEMVMEKLDSMLSKTSTQVNFKSLLNLAMRYVGLVIGQRDRMTEFYDFKAQEDLFSNLIFGCLVGILDV